MLLNFMQTCYRFFSKKFGITMVVVVALIDMDHQQCFFDLFAGLVEIMLYFDLLERYMLTYSLYLIHAAILQFPAIHKKKPPRSGYRRAKTNRKIAIFCIKS